MMRRLRVLVRAVQFGLASAESGRQAILARKVTGLAHHEDRDCRLCAFTRAADRAEEAARHRLFDAVREAQT